MFSNDLCPIKYLVKLCSSQQSKTLIKGPFPLSQKSTRKFDYLHLLAMREIAFSLDARTLCKLASELGKEWKRCLLGRFLRDFCEIFHCRLPYCSTNIQTRISAIEVYAGKYCLRFFVQVFLCDKNQRQYFLVQTEETRLIRDLLYGLLDRNFF